MPLSTPPADGRTGLLEDLNEPQREAVTHGTGPLLVVAGAGTGKTRVLTRRVAWLVAGGLPSHAVLAITFTNKAADVLKNRLAALLPGRRVHASTFHAFAALLLRQEGEAIGISPDYTILDRDDQKRILKTLLADLGSDAARFKPAEVIAMISHVKNGGGGRAPLDLSQPDVEVLFERLLSGYTDRLRTGDLLDFDDLLLEAWRVLRDVAEVGERVRRRYAHVLVDEYQDTNVVQAEMLSLLLGPSKNLTVVGDPDQSIYRWRGAAVRNILEFDQDFEGARTVVLEQNYRSTRTILDAAEHVIARNTQRHAKRLHTEKEEGTPVRIVRCRDAEDEAETVARQLETWRAEGRSLGDMAVFYRVNSLSRSLEMALRSRAVPYVVVAGVEFFQRREVKDLLAYARLVENPNDEAAFLRVSNVPRRGVGAASLKKLRHAAIALGTSSLQAARHRAEVVSPRARSGLRKLLTLLDEAREMPRAPVAPLLEHLAQQSGYRAWLVGQEDALDASRVENIDELIAFAHEWDRNDDQGDLRAFLERTALVSDQDAYDEDEEGRVSLMSVHAAKGLEFPCVVISGAEDELFPHARNAEDPQGAEEERRLFYVAMTRAMECLTMTHTARRFDWRGDVPRLPSPFLRDIPSERVEVEDRVGRQPGLFHTDPGWDAHGDDVAVVRESGGSLVDGERVRHPYFGDGWLQTTHGSGQDTRVTVIFDRHGRKQLLLSHARLERIG